MNIFKIFTIPTGNLTINNIQLEGNRIVILVILCFLGVVGVAAAAAITSSKKKKRPHSFETNPSIRKRQQNRLLRKLRVSNKFNCIKLERLK